MTEPAPQVDFYFSFRSPYSYLAIGRLADWAGAEGVDLRLRPVLPLAIRSPEFFTKGNPQQPRYLFLDSHRTAAFLGIPFRWPEPDPVVIALDPVVIPAEQPYIHRLTRLGAAAARHGAGVAFARAVSHLIWSGAVQGWHEGPHLAQAAAGAGLDLAALDAEVAAEAPALDAIIAQNQADHKASGHWGVPLMVYAGEPFFGQDRIDMLKWRVAQSRKTASSG
ncbi:MAG: DsbA family protein [Pseudomonadota bacterium]